MEEAVKGGPGNFTVTYHDIITALAFLFRWHAARCRK